jgi:predicted ATP-grasp superfamily ATP-dependent carboligase
VGITTPRRPRVFVTDGSYPNGLAAIRALSRAGFHVTVAERAGISPSATIGFWSRGCHERFQYPDPQQQPDACARALSEHFEKTAYAAAIPVGLDMAELFVRYRDALPVPAMLAPPESFRIAADKRLTYEYAGANGIPTPRTVAAADWRLLEIPVVFKHYRKGAFIARSTGEAAAYARDIAYVIDEYIAQEYIPGENGFGYFGFFDSGTEAGYFMHERLMQFPKEGGPSVVARSFRNPQLHELGRRLLESLGWHGVAMVEFKRSDRNGAFYLMEINPKLWGSLDLAVQSGCNFPVWIARALSDGSHPRNGHYREGLTYQWVIPNGIKSFMRYPEFRVPFVRNFVSGVRTDIQWNDPLPTAAGLVTMAANARRR